MAKTPAKKKVAAKKKSAKKKPKAAKKAKISTLFKKIADSKRRLERAKETAVREGERLFNSAVKDIFKKFPDLQSFSWTQYTMNWNDGDPCSFSCYFDSIAIDDEHDRDEIEDIFTLEHMSNLLSKKDREEARIIMELTNKTDKDQWEIDRLKHDLDTIQKRNPEQVFKKYEVKRYVFDLIKEIDESIYESMFGEGRVVVTRDGARVEDYEHD